MTGDDFCIAVPRYSYSSLTPLDYAMIQGASMDALDSRRSFGDRQNIGSGKGWSEATRREEA